MSMWNKRPDELAPKPAATVPPVTPAEPKKETPVASTSFRHPEPEVARSGSASIGKAVKINGQIFSKEDLYIDGDIEGTVELLENKLTIGPNGKVLATVRAREVVVLGQIQGNVEANERLEIRKDARLIGDIKTARIAVEDGAYFKGSIDIVKSEPARSAAPVSTPASSNAPSAPPVPPRVATAAADVKR
jgi:cytoskeletal protein CcmA (bactofilin family)